MASLLTTLRKALTPELFTQVTDALGDNFDYDLVPRTRLNEVIRQRNEYREQLAGIPQQPSDDPQPQQPSGAPQQPPLQQQQPAVDEAALRAQFERERDEAINGVKIQYAALDKLREAHAIDPELAWSLVDKSKVKFDDKGALTGLDDQIKGLTEGKPFLFSSVQDGVPAGTGKDGSNSGGAGPDAQKNAQDAALSQVFKSFGVEL